MWVWGCGCGCGGEEGGPIGYTGYWMRVNLNSGPLLFIDPITWALITALDIRYAGDGVRV